MRQTLMTMIGILAFLAAPYQTHAQENSGAGPQVEAIIQEYENKVRANTIKMIEAKTEAEKDQYRQSVPSVAPYATRVMEVVKAHAGQPETARGVSWLVTQAGGFPEGQEALKLIGSSYASVPGIAEAVKALEYYPPAVAEPVLKAVREKNPGDAEKAAATYALGVQQFRIYDSAGPNGESAEGKAAKEKAMEYFQEVLTAYPNAQIQGFPLADQASRMMFEMANLSVGVEAPEIEGKDLEGASFKLSDYRGKHVMLIFWGGWCHACHDVIPQVNELAKDLKDKPAVVLGINSDIPEEAREAFAKYGVTFRNWSDGATSGPITSMFNLRSFPTIYLIDPKGVILLKNTSVEAVKEHLKTL